MVNNIAYLNHSLQIRLGDDASSGLRLKARTNLYSKKNSYSTEKLSVKKRAQVYESHTVFS